MLQCMTGIKLHGLSRSIWRRVPSQVPLRAPCIISRSHKSNLSKEVRPTKCCVCVCVLSTRTLPDFILIWLASPVVVVHQKQSERTARSSRPPFKIHMLWSVKTQWKYPLQWLHWGRGSKWAKKSSSILIRSEVTLSHSRNSEYCSRLVIGLAVERMTSGVLCNRASTVTLNKLQTMLFGTWLRLRR